MFTSSLRLSLPVVFALFLNFIAGQNSTQEQQSNAKRTISIGIVLFPGFEPLDVYGPLEIFFSLSADYKMTLSTISHTTGPVSSRPPLHRMDDDPSSPPMDLGYALGPSTVATHTFADAPALDIILVPGGIGNFALVQANDTHIEDFVARRFDQADYVLSVCSGSVHLARSGILNGKKATTNKGVWAWVTKNGESYRGAGIEWVPSARWVESGKVWTSSGVAAGLDMAYAFLKHVYGTEVLDAHMNGIEYAPHTNPHWDPFSVVHNVPGASQNESLVDCTAPVGYS